MLRIHLNAVCNMHMHCSNGHESEGKADVISFIAIMSTHCFPFILLPRFTFSRSHYLISERLAVLISFTLPNQQTYWSALVRFASVRSTQCCSFGGKIRKSTVWMFRNDFCSPIKCERGEKVKRVINLIKFQMRNATSKIRTRETETNRVKKVTEQQCTRNMCFLCCVEIKNCKLQSQCKYCCVQHTKKPHMHHNIGISESRDLHSKSSHTTSESEWWLQLLLLLLWHFISRSPPIALSLFLFLFQLSPIKHA